MAIQVTSTSKSALYLVAVPQSCLATSPELPGDLPAARLQQILFFELANIKALHRVAQLFGSFEHDFRVLVSAWWPSRWRARASPDRST